ncbi:hypothetical protein TH66_09030 [Carbonactinospora thermoautotrophica]|uniref:Uncharacterized protein n=1 Tax=Carbonactinospora thermoautotrophica TaxID=1469144 RepID=A0A132N9P1_9ACTN|nr:hypothetical protein [Carbonactinospora thermoautotrophica]KWX04070.1 hypothetical protein TH66_09030 [Carbonactinospora thermoautotrophica]KWX06823.1 hypothetical protein TR74_20720 [Carbonactinospora thermoautotrophica]
MRSSSYLLVPFVVFLVMGLLMLLLRWTFSRGRSLVARPPRTGHPTEYGMLVSVAAPRSYEEGERLRQQLLDQDIRATVTLTDQGLRLFVWPEDELRARTVLDRD